MAERNYAHDASSNRILTDNQTHEFKLGNSFKKNVYSAFHTMRYDFKPASVDTTKDASLEVYKGNGIKVTVPHIEGTGAEFVYKGPKKPVQKECVLIIDNKTGEITLERLSSCIQLKKQRLEGSSKASANRPHTPVDHNKQKSSSLSPPKGKKEPTPPAVVQDAEKDLSPFSIGPPSIPSPPAPHHVSSSLSSLGSASHPSPTIAEDLIMSSSDSSDSSSGDSSDDSSSEDDDDFNDDQCKRKKVTHSPIHSTMTGGSEQKKHRTSSEFNQLCQDLQLSESGSDSD
ncbi:uncharacterized protein LOC100371889 [Saccoglossus kowalevskii]|uniref:ELL-associated factor 1-like n=1 Tax=Saccoglossus kowalevskii TaxID=10224 RepID=A0ABM0GVU3_SACKO|nr:PREDICTED: ELL-associated factor 1-like [Saccoglossus kowalevskii]